MLKSTLLEILRSFSKEDLERFDDFANSPFFNKKSSVVKLYSEIKKYAPAFEDEKLEKESMWKLLFPDKKYNYGVLKNLIHDLTKLSEEYLGYTYREKDMDSDRNLIESLYQRNMMKILSKKMKKFYNDLNKIKRHDLEYFKKKLFILPYINTGNNESLMVDDTRVITNEVALKYFLLNYLPNSFHLVVEEQRTNIKHDHSFLRYLLQYFDKKENFFSDSFELQIYYHLMLSYLDIQDDVNYEHAYSILTKAFNTLSITDKKNFYNILHTLCILKNDNGKEEYNRKRLKLLMEMADKGVLFHKQNEQIPMSTYRAIVAMMCESEEYDLLNNFIAKYGKTTGMINSELSLYSDAMMTFSKREFKKCLEFTSKINFSDIANSVSANYYIKNDVKILVAKSFYELNMIENLISALDAHKHFLKNANYISDINKLPVVNFINNFNELIKLKSRNDIHGLQKLSRKIKNTKYMNSTKWFVKKINEIID